jgi:hypothetical protein
VEFSPGITPLGGDSYDTQFTTPALDVALFAMVILVLIASYRWPQTGWFSLGAFLAPLWIEGIAAHQRYLTEWGGDPMEALWSLAYGCLSIVIFPFWLAAWLFGRGRRKAIEAQHLKDLEAELATNPPKFHITEAD